MKCPECKVSLFHSHHGSLEIDVCKSCDGIWFDRGELESYSMNANDARVPTEAGAHLFSPESEVFRICLKCLSGTLAMGAIGQLDAGRCRQCQGVWLNPTPADSDQKAGEVRESLGEAIDMFFTLFFTIAK